MKKPKEERSLLFDRSKYSFMIAGLGLAALGFVLMIGGGSKDPNHFSDSIFSFRRITLAPILVLAGFALQVYAILKKTAGTTKTQEKEGK